MKKYILIIALLVTSLAFSQGYKKNVYNVGDLVGVLTISPTYELDVVGNIGMSNYLYHNDDPNTYLRFEDDLIYLNSGNVEFLRMYETTQNQFTINEGGIDIDIRIEATGSTAAFFVRGSDGNVGINQNTPTEKLDVVGNIKLSGVLIGDESVDKDNLATALKTKVALGNVSGTVDIDTSLGIHFTMTMTGNITSLTFSNLTNEELKTITLQIDGNFTIAQPSSVKGDWTGFDGTKTNQIQIYLFDISTPTFSSALLNW